MGAEQMGSFICALRKEQGLTQKALAERLGITDKAVSKWERNLSCPDITLLPALAKVLGVTPNELLNGVRDTAPAASVCLAALPPESRPASAPAAPAHPAREVPSHAVPPGSAGRDEPPPPARRLRISPALHECCALGWGLLLLVGAALCLICDLAVTGGLSWSLYPAASCLLAGCVTLPLIRRGAKGVPVALGRLTLLIGPYLAVIDWVLAHSDPRAPVSILPVGVAAALPGLLFLWGCFYAASWFRGRPLRVGAACAGLAAVACLAENALLAPLLNIRFLDLWDWLVMLLLALLAAALLWLDGRSSLTDAAAKDGTD